MSIVQSTNAVARVSFAAQTQGKSVKAVAKKAGGKKSILKRAVPPSLPMSPTSHSASASAFPIRGINALISPSNNTFGDFEDPMSPHVHFPPTPGMTTQSFAASYERAAAKPIQGKRTIPANIPSDVQSDKPTRASKVFRSRPGSALQFESKALNSPVLAAPETPANNVYPVSPYPYGTFPRSPLSASCFPIVSSPLANRQFGGIARNNKENGSRCAPCVGRKRGKRPTALHMPPVHVLNPFLEEVITTPITADMLSPVVVDSTESDVSEGVRLSSAFWRSVSLIDLNDESEMMEPIVGCTYPDSALALQSALTVDLSSPMTTSMMKRNLDLNLTLELTPMDMDAVELDIASPPPSVMFGRNDGTLWSPGLDRTTTRVPESAVSSEMSMYTASAGYSAAAAVFSPGMHSPQVTSFGAHRSSFGQAVSRFGMSSPGFNKSARLGLNDDLAAGLNSPAPFRGNPNSSSFGGVSVTSPGPEMSMASFGALQSPSVTSTFGSMAQHHGLGFTSPSPMGAAFPSFGAAAAQIELPQKAMLGAMASEGRLRVL